MKRITSLLVIVMLTVFAATCGTAADDAKKAEKAVAPVTSPAPPTLEQMQQQRAALQFVIRGIELSKAAVEDRMVAAKVELSQIEAKIAEMTPKK